MLNWLQQFNTFCFLDNHGYQIVPHTQECLVAAGVRRMCLASPGESLNTLQKFIDSEKPGWLFGHLAYDLKNELAPLQSRHPDGIAFPDMCFFEPAIVIRLNEATLTIEADNPDDVYSEIMSTDRSKGRSDFAVPDIRHRMTRDEYLDAIRALRKHILRGDCYEINFCQEFFAIGARIDPVHVYRYLSNISPNPFSALYRFHDRWLICASPERFLKKEGSRILSQPIKGTSGRVTSDNKQDAENRDSLFNSAKDRSENVMVVDLVRNDLARICTEGSVKVDELYGVYSFPQVHQMISTVSGEADPRFGFTDIIRATFPMGSMTGAPKRRVMELIEQYERTRRGIFSGALGYISPSGDFDFNVVIRSLLYNETTNYLSFPAGSGITFYSDPEQEWEECLLKAAAIRQVLSS